MVHTNHKSAGRKADLTTQTKSAADPQLTFICLFIYFFISFFIFYFWFYISLYQIFPWQVSRQDDIGSFKRCNIRERGQIKRFAYHTCLSTKLRSS